MSRIDEVIDRDQWVWPEQHPNPQVVDVACHRPLTQERCEWSARVPHAVCPPAPIRKDLVTCPTPIKPLRQEACVRLPQYSNKLRVSKRPPKSGIGHVCRDEINGG